MVARWFVNLRVFLVWLLGFALALIIMILYHELVMVFVVSTLQWEENIILLVHVLYYLLTGLLWFAFFLISMEYLKQSAGKSMLLRGSLLIAGTQLLLISLAQVGLTLYEYFPADRLGITLIVVEGLLGASALFLARHTRKVKNRIWFKQN
jgi:hypothetical protein